MYVYIHISIWFLCTHILCSEVVCDDLAQVPFPHQNSVSCSVKVMVFGIGWGTDWNKGYKGLEQKAKLRNRFQFCKGQAVSPDIPDRASSWARKKPLPWPAGPPSEKARKEKLCARQDEGENTEWLIFLPLLGSQELRGGPFVGCGLPKRLGEWKLPYTPTSQLLSLSSAWPAALELNFVVPRERPGGASSPLNVQRSVLRKT